MAVSYDYYRIFYYAAKYQSFTRAAAALDSNQPNISRAMNNLEYELGCRLFIRSHRGIRLTPEGAQLYGHVASAFSQLQLGEAELTGAVNLRRGVVSVGTSETAMHILMLDALGRFHKTYPGVRLRVSNHTTPSAISALRSGQVDLAVIPSPAAVSAPLRQSALCRFQDILIGGRQFASLADTPMTLSALAAYPLICLARNTTSYEFYSRLFLASGCTLEPDVEVTTPDLILPMVENDLGLAFLPETFARDAIAAGRVIRIPLAVPIPPREICLVQDAGRGLSVAARALISLLRETDWNQNG